MVKIVIGKEYLHYITKGLQEACEIKDELQYAYCKFSPGGMECNVVSWRCLDIRNLVFEDEMRDHYVSFYNSALAQVKKQKEEEKECLQEVSDIAKVLGILANLAMTSLGVSKKSLISYYNRKEDSEENNISNQKYELSSTNSGVSLYGSGKVQVFMAVFFGAEVCYNNDNGEIYMLPQANLVGYIEPHHDGGDLGL